MRISCKLSKIKEIILQLRSDEYKNSLDFLKKVHFPAHMNLLFLLVLTMPTPNNQLLSIAVLSERDSSNALKDQTTAC